VEGIPGGHKEGGKRCFRRRQRSLKSQHAPGAVKEDERLKR